ncbi:HAMP domain-containing sensor histidine kinase [Actinokineospora sp.]|uniref:HAMP domain-containing sensor histidine kinase n=1 Tax=Actinokineospora sp. TaxID=1872133 RepID=UPI003D6B56EC
MKRASIAVRITALGLAVAGVVAVVGGLVSARLVVQTAREVTRQTLSDQADVVAGQLSDSKLGLRRVVEVLGGQGVAVVQVRPNGNVVSSDATAERAARQAGITELAGPVHTTVELNGRVLLVELRPADPRGAIGLVRETETAKGVGRTLVRNIAFALGLGLLVAAVAGLILAGLLSRPLRRTAAVATSMSHGRRDLRAPVDGPREVAEVAASVNELADALHRSEARQRDFLLSVSHELRTPLTAVKGFAESLADGVVTGDAVAAAGRTIDQEATRLDRLVADLLDLARLGADDFRLDVVAVDLTALVTETATVWSARCAAAGIRFRLEAPAEPVVVHADPRRLRQVLDGLAENALRVTPSGRPMVLALSREPGAAVLQVRDGGPGLAPQDYAVAFERGVLNARYSGSRPVGTGIGLALVHGLVNRMGGVIEAGPAPEGGAAFTVRFRTA